MLMGVDALTIQNAIMILAGCGLLYLGIKKNYEPLLWCHRFWAVLVISLADMMGRKGFCVSSITGGSLTRSSLPHLHCIGAMTDFHRLFWKTPRSSSSGGRAVRDFLTSSWRLLWDSTVGCVSIASSVPVTATSIYVTRSSPSSPRAVSVAANPTWPWCLSSSPHHALLTTSGKKVKMEYPEKSVSRNARSSSHCCDGRYLPDRSHGTLLWERSCWAISSRNVCGKPSLQCSQNEMANAVTLLLGISIGPPWTAPPSPSRNPHDPGSASWRSVSTR